MPICISQDAHIHYQTFGDANAPAVIFSNSLGTNDQMWQAQIDALQHDHFVICYDTRGHGRSSAPQGPYTLQQLGQDVIELLDHLEIQRASFCGISMGGLTGQWLAIQYPHRFQHLVISNSAAKVGQESAWRERAALVRQQGLRQIAETAASRWFSDGFIQNHHAVVEKLSQDLAAGSAEGYASCCEALAEADLREQIQQISIPTLIIAGAKDPVTTVADAEFMQQRIQDSQMIRLDASHISNIEAADAFNQALRAFIAA